MTLCLVMYLPLLGRYMGSVSPGTQVYLLIMQIAGLGWIGASGNFGYLHNSTAWKIEPDFGNTGVVAGVFSAAYFGSLLFISLLLFALLHFVLTYEHPRRIFQGCGGLGAGLCAFAMVAASVALGNFTTPIPTEDFWDQQTTAKITGEMLITNGDCNFLVPMVMLGMCVAELRYHLSATTRAVLGHWLTVDLVIVAFIVLTFAPISNISEYGQNHDLRMCQRLAPLDKDDFQKKLKGYSIFCATTTPSLTGSCDYSTVVDYIARLCDVAQIQNSWLPKSIVIEGSQQILFCLVLMCLSCQAHHKKRSLVVFGIFERSVVRDFLGKYSYVLYLFPQVLLHHYVTTWLGTKSLHGEMARLLVGVLAVTLAMIAQWWQDTYVLQANVWLLNFLRSDWYGALANERNPLAGLVVWWNTPSDKSSLTQQQKPDVTPNIPGTPTPQKYHFRDPHENSDLNMKIENSDPHAGLP